MVIEVGMEHGDPIAVYLLPEGNGPGQKLNLPDPCKEGTRIKPDGSEMKNREPVKPADFINEGSQERQEGASEGSKQDAAPPAEQPCQSPEEVDWLLSSPHRDPARRAEAFLPEWLRRMNLG